MALAIGCGYRLSRRYASPLMALAWTLALLFLSVTPVYLVWPQPEILDLALVAAGLDAWASDAPVLSAVLFGIATYSKPTNLLVALPLGVDPLLATAGWWRGLGESARRGAVLLAVVAAFYGLNGLVTGELNYQGGERKTFYGAFPEEAPGVTFGNSGIWMTTNHVGPPVAGLDATTRARGAETPLAAQEVREAFLANLGYFWFGRYAGAAVYFTPVFAAVLLFLLRGPRDRAGWLAVAALALSWLAYITLIPDNWYGGGGTVGNRYFVNLVPLGFLLLPRGRVLPALLASAVGAAAFTAPVLLHPFDNSRRPGLHAREGVFRRLPLERTLLDDLGFCHESWRCRQPVGDTEGDPHLGWPPDPHAYYLYFPDDGTEAGLEAEAGRAGFRMRPGAHAEVVLRALVPVRAIGVQVHGGREGDILEVHGAGPALHLPVAPGRTAAGSLAKPGPGLLYHGERVYVLEFRSRAEAAGGEAAAAFVSLTLEVASPTAH